MLIQPFQPHELHFAYCYRVYFRWQTAKNLPCAPLALLDARQMYGLSSPYQIRVLECSSSVTELLTIVSLKPQETISGCASKLKGQVSKWLRNRLQLREPTKLLSRSYFACTIGKSKTRVIERYLDRQGEHHGYGRRLLPPVFVEQYALTAGDEERLAVKHACVIARFHIVLSTCKRLGILGSQEGQRIAAAWQKAQTELHASIIKVSFVPDHVHFALRIHPTVSPADVVVSLMNIAQDAIQDSLVRSGVNRLWEPSAYVGGYGDLASAQLRKYLKKFELI